MMRATRKQNCRWIPGLFLFYPLFLVQIDPHPADNLAIFDRLASNLIQEILVQAAPDTSQHIAIKSLRREESGNWWLENWFAKVLIDRGVRNVYIHQEQRFEEGLIIEYRINDLRVKYVPAQEKNFVTRKFTLDLDVRLMEAKTGLVILLDRATQQYADTVQVNLLKELEDESYPFTTTEAPRRQGIRNYIEPLVVMATTAGVIYLFFHLRSN